MQQMQVVESIVPEKDYEAGRFQSMGRNAAQRAGINRRAGGRVV